MDRTKPGPNASSSDDLERARAASQRLKGSTTAKAPEPGYVSFAAPAEAPPGPPWRATRAPGTVPPRIAPVRPTPAPQPRPSLAPIVTRREPLKGPTAGFGSAGWNKLLDACLQTVGADSAFLMDPHGLIIASRGSKPSEQLEATGARLMVAFEQADRIGAEVEGAKPALSMSVELPQGTLHGLRLVQPEGVLMLGLSIPGGMSAERQARLVSLLAAAE